MKPETKRAVPRRIIVGMAQDIGKRDEQQDYCIYSDLYNYEACESGGIAVVADGMGGYENGKNAARTGARSFLEFYKKNQSTNINKKLIDSMNYANNAVNKLKEGGTTLVCAVVDDWKLYWLSVGDSRIYLYRNGLLRRLNIEHNYKHRLIQKVESGEISFRRAMTDKNRHALTSFMGLEDITEYDYNDCIFPLLRHDKVLLCSDGLYKVLSDSEAEKILSGRIGAFADELVRCALEKRRQNQDNITAVILNIE